MRLCLLLCVVLGLVSAALAGNCTLIEPVNLQRDSSLYVIAGGNVSLFPVKDGQAMLSSSMRWELSYIIERQKQQKDMDGNPTDPYISMPWRGPVNLIPVDPLEPSVPNVACVGGSAPCGLILNHFDPLDYDCWAEHVSAPFHGFTRESVFVHFTHHLYPDFQIVVGNHLTDGYVEINPVSSGAQDVNIYRPGALKVTYEILHFPWAETAPIAYFPTAHNGSAVEIWWDMYLEMDRPHTIVNINTPDRRNVTVDSADGQIHMGVDVSSVIVTDGYGVSFYGGNSRIERTFDAIKLHINAPVGINDINVTRWTNAIYDPTLSAVFNPPLDPSAPPSAANKGLSGGVKAAIIVVVLLVVVIAVAIALLAKFNPTVRAFFRPYAKREELARAESIRRSTWTRASLPVQDEEMSITTSSSR